MKRAFKNGFAIAAGVFILMIVGCQEQQAPGGKQCRLIAAENIELKKELARRDDAAERMTRLHDSQMKQQQGLLADCKKQQEMLTEKLEQKTRKEIEEVLKVLTEQSAQLTRENAKLKADLAECRDTGKSE